MKEEIFFSVIIPTYNRATFIEKTIHSVLNQSEQNFELIVVDDGSTDNTEEIVKQIPSSKIKYYRIKNSERGAARNFGASVAGGAYLNFLDSDDMVYRNYLANALESIQVNNYPPFVHVAYEIKNDHGHLLSKMNFIKSDTEKFLIYGNQLSCIGIFLRKEIFDRFKFNEDRHLSGSEDWELWLRVVANHGIKTDNRISAAMIFHDERSVLNTNERKLVLRKELCLRYAFMDPKVNEVYGQYKRKIEAFCDSYIALHLALAGGKLKPLKHLAKGLLRYPGLLFTRRFLAVMKQLIIRK
ncbi:MAG TPA: glycosyltransferase [Bacteroidia bacterium]|nr:glycosyltransferase [Bacteroidia bacterium]